MNKTSIIFAALLGATALTAQAQEMYAPAQVQSNSTLTRAQVRQEVLAAQKSGALNHNDVDLPDTTASNDAFGRTRASVKAETLAARATGGLDHDDVDLPNVAKGSVFTRQQVRAEAVASRQLVRTAPGRNTIDY